ncbi:glycosyltransferase [Specibacter sp. NPDC057265]|uniref:glycosyltransferase n=1 Tax=Specibacter sp. NPDC057265 TaxID=3346075 RepID=UPI0036297189
MVAHNGGAYLPGVLAAVAAQTRPANHVVAADLASTDNSGELLRRELGERHVIYLDGVKSYGAAVDAVLAQQGKLELAHQGASVRSSSAADGTAPHDGAAATAPHDGTAPHGGAAPHDGADAVGGENGGAEWIWLLQDDAAPAPDALQLLLEATERATTATVVGCKQLDWDSRRRLVDVGLWANNHFDRFTLVGLDEQDQGQYDNRADVFAVNTAGMLVRRDVFDRLGGFDVAVPGPGDDLDFCARVRLTGGRVLVVPAARMHHVVDRPHGLGSAVAARKAGVFLRLKHAPAAMVPVLVLGTFVAAFYWLIAGFVLKAPGHALRMFAATLAGLARPRQLLRSRRELAAQRTKPRSVHKGVLVDNRSARAHLKMLRETVGPDVEAPTEVTAGPSLVEPTGESHQETVAPLAHVKTAPVVSALALVALLSVFSLLALGRFLTAPALTGGALLPVTEQGAAVWRHATDWWVSLGSGMPGRGNPFNFVLALLAGAGGNGSLSALWLVLLALPLSALTAWLATGAFTRQRWPRIVAALAWAGAPALLVAMGQGRLGALLAHVLIPLVMLGLVRAAGGAIGPRPAALGVPGVVESASPVAKLGRPGVDGNPSWTAAAAAGLALAAVTAAAPSLLPIALLGILAAALLLRRRGRTIWWALVPPVALFVPFAWSARSNPRALLADPGLPLPSTAGPLWQQLLGFPEQLAAGDGLLELGSVFAASWWTPVAAFVIGAPVVAAAVAALLLPLRRAATVRTMWLVALLALLGAHAGAFIAVAFDGGTLVTPFSGPAVSLAFFALLAAALTAFDAVHRRAYAPAGTTAGSADGATARRGARTISVVLSVLLLAAPLASLGLWGAQQFSQPAQPALTGPFQVQGVTAGTIPATAADRGTGPEASRTIVLAVQPDGGMQATLMQGDGTTLDATSTIAAAARVTGAPGDEAVLAPDEATAALQDSVAAMLSKAGIDPRAGLVDLGVGFVVLRPGDTAAELLASELEAVPGLDTVGPTESGWLWRVQPSYATAGLSDVVNRVRLVDADGASLAPVPSQGQSVKTDIAAGAAGRRVVLAERADSHWQGWLNGERLEAADAGWAQAFELPAGAGELEIRYVHPAALATGVLQLVLFGLTVLLALPVRARRGRTGAYRDEASLQKVGRGA